ncbi:hypothetical protein N7510_004235 [Penicillium lagena]|uniref:uncharacterized protein n=1 Tax=Penicillium lagena TaxID=94218 RepID=UPI00254085B7|nr:uncharacterized protein N7510_004235 [Penicillium lagena]KAJ5620251.1 hypothetical protein N7510_004235 [Penicillium lagena]
MPDVINLVSSDPPSPKRPPPQSQQPTNQLPSRHPSHREPISSDSIDVSLFDYDDLTSANPVKKRKVTGENPSPLRQSTTAHESKAPDLDPRFLFSDDDFGLPPSNPAAQKKPSQLNVEDSDPIMFTSSLPLPEHRAKPAVAQKPNPSQISDIITLNDDDDDDFMKITTTRKATLNIGRDDIEEFSDPFSLPDFNDLIGLAEQGTAASNTVFSSRTAGLLSNISDQKAKIKSSSKGKGRSQKEDGSFPALGNMSDELDEPIEPRRPAKKSSKLTSEEKEAKAKAREEAKAQKERERQLEKERKQKLKGEKAREKQLAADISEVNKLKVDKKDSTPEMIIDMALSLEGSSVGNQTVEFMKRHGVEQTFFTSPISHVVKWRRKMTAKYNETVGHWEPCPLHIQEERHVLCLVPAQDFVDMVISDPENSERDTLEIHVLRIKSAYPDCKLIYLIEGLTVWMRKNRNSRNKAYQAAVLRQYEQNAATTSEAGEGSSAPRGRKKKNKPETTRPVDDDTVEDALLALQVTHSCLIHHTGAAPESAEWIKNFTEHISTIPYRRERMEGNDAAFCMDVGQVKSGEDKLDTFVKMLQEVNRVTAAMAYGITTQYPSVTDLVRAMRMHGPTLLEDVRKSANKNGALTDSRVGPAASKRLYKVFTGQDPASTDV